MALSQTSFCQHLERADIVVQTLVMDCSSQACRARPCLPSQPHAPTEWDAARLLLLETAPLEVSVLFPIFLGPRLPLSLSPSVPPFLSSLRPSLRPSVGLPPSSMSVRPLAVSSALRLCLDSLFRCYADSSFRRCVFCRFAFFVLADYRITPAGFKRWKWRPTWMSPVREVPLRSRGFLQSHLHGAVF